MDCCDRFWTAGHVLSVVSGGLIEGFVVGNIVIGECVKDNLSNIIRRLVKDNQNYILFSTSMHRTDGVMKKINSFGNVEIKIVISRWFG
jgi:hypothetical protein